MDEYTPLPRLLIAAALTAVLAACDSSGSSSTNTPKTVEPVEKVDTVAEALTSLESRGDIPTLDADDSLAGIDVEDNGLRDDIEDYIAGLSLSAGQKNALSAFAANLQRILQADLDDPAQLEAVGSQMTMAVRCLNRQFSDPAEGYRYLKQVEHYTANTELRAQKYTAYNLAMDGTVTRLADPLQCE